MPRSSPRRTSRRLLIALAGGLALAPLATAGPAAAAPGSTHHLALRRPPVRGPGVAGEGSGLPRRAAGRAAAALPVPAGIGPNVAVSDPGDPVGILSETAVAADPVQPAHLAAGANIIRGPANRMGAYTSTDSGQTWSRPPGPGGTRSQVSDPSLAYSPDGTTLYYAYLAFDSGGAGGTSLDLAVSGDGGATWAAPVTLERDTCPDKPLVAVHGSRIYIAYDQNLPASTSTCGTGDQPLFLAYSPDGGHTWASTLVHDGPGNIGGYPVVDAAGNVYVAWDDYTANAVRIARSSDGGQSFGRPVLVAATASGFGVRLPGWDAASACGGVRRVGPMPALAVQGSDLYVAWADQLTSGGRMHIYLSRSADSGATWSAPVLIDAGNPNDAWEPAISVDPSTQAITLAWYDRRDDPANKLYRVYYTQSADGGHSFAVPIPVADAASDPGLDCNGTGDYMQMASVSGSAHPVWSDTRNGVNQIYTAAVDEAALAGTVQVLDGWGGIHEAGGAPHLANSAYWAGWDIARGLALNRDGASGYVLDGWGGIHPVGGAAPVGGPIAYWPGWDIARGIVTASWSTAAAPAGYVLDGWGGIHPFGNAPAITGPIAYWRGWDIARGIVLSPDSTPTGVGGYVLDGWGGVHPFGKAASVGGPIAYWPGWDITRGIALLPGSTLARPQGWVLDGWGGVHPFGGAPTVAVSDYWHADLARGMALWAGGGGAGGGWVLDAYGGLHGFSAPGASLPALVDSAAFTWDIARGAAGAGEGSGAGKH